MDGHYELPSRAKGTSAAFFFPLGLTCCAGVGAQNKPCEESGDGSVLIAEGHLHTRLFGALFCPSRVDLTG